MKSYQEIYDQLHLIMENSSLDGTILDILNRLLARSIFENEISQVSDILESSFLRSTKLKNKLLHAFHRSYSVFRGRNQVVRFKNFIPLVNIDFKKFDKILEFGDYILLAAEDYYYKPNSSEENSMTIDCIVCKKNAYGQVDLPINSEILIKTNIKDVSEDIYLEVVKDGALIDAVISNSIIDQNSKSMNSNLFIANTTDDYSVNFIYLPRLKNINSISYHYIKYLPEDIDISKITYLPKFDRGYNSEIISVPHQPRNEDILDIYLSTILNFRSSRVVPSNVSFGSLVAKYAQELFPDSKFGYYLDRTNPFDTATVKLIPFSDVLATTRIEGKATDDSSFDPIYNIGSYLIQSSTDLGGLNLATIQEGTYNIISSSDKLCKSLTFQSDFRAELVSELDRKLYKLYLLDRTKEYYENGELVDIKNSTIYPLIAFNNITNEFIEKNGETDSGYFNTSESREFIIKEYNLEEEVSTVKGQTAHASRTIPYSEFIRSTNLVIPFSTISPNSKPGVIYSIGIDGILVSETGVNTYINITSDTNTANQEYYIKSSDETWEYTHIIKLVFVYDINDSEQLANGIMIPDGSIPTPRYYLPNSNVFLVLSPVKSYKKLKDQPSSEEIPISNEFNLLDNSYLTFNVEDYDSLDSVDPTSNETVGENDDSFSKFYDDAGVPVINRLIGSKYYRYCTVLDDHRFNNLIFKVAVSLKDTSGKYQVLYYKYFRRTDGSELSSGIYIDSLSSFVSGTDLTPLTDSEAQLVELEFGSQWSSYSSYVYIENVTRLTILGLLCNSSNLINGEYVDRVDYTDYEGTESSVVSVFYSKQAIQDLNNQITISISLVSDLCSDGYRYIFTKDHFSSKFKLHKLMDASGVEFNPEEVGSLLSISQSDLEAISASLVPAPESNLVKSGLYTYTLNNIPSMIYNRTYENSSQNLNFNISQRTITIGGVAHTFRSSMEIINHYDLLIVREVPYSYDYKGKSIYKSRVPIPSVIDPTVTDGEESHSVICSFGSAPYLYYHDDIILQFNGFGNLETKLGTLTAGVDYLTTTNASTGYFKSFTAQFSCSSITQSGTSIFYYLADGDFSIDLLMSKLSENHINTELFKSKKVEPSVPISLNLRISYNSDLGNIKTAIDEVIEKYKYELPQYYMLSELLVRLNKIPGIKGIEDEGSSVESMYLGSSIESATFIDMKYMNIDKQLSYIWSKE